ncbi:MULTISPECIES: hypothetical protein [Streptomyces]|nr:MULTISPECIES: hypothetical protein [Streptomyces]
MEERPKDAELGLGAKLLAKAAPKAIEVVGGLFGKAAEAGESGAG